MREIAGILKTIWANKKMQLNSITDFRYHSKRFHFYNICLKYKLEIQIKPQILIKEKLNRRQFKALFYL